MKNLISMFIGAFILVSPSFVYAQIEASPQQMSRLFTNRCTTDYCHKVHSEISDGDYGSQRVVSSNRVDACINYNNQLGQYISKVSYAASQKYSYDQAAKIRAAIYQETYHVRSELRNIISYGDRNQCGILYNKAIQIINNIKG